MNLKYLLKEANYYLRLGRGQLKRIGMKFLLAKTPLSKLVNSKYYNKVYYRIVNKKIESLKPYTLQIENTNICNAKCVMCPHTHMKRKGKVMDQKEFEKICKNVLDYYPIKLLIITGFGEPLIDAGLAEKIKWLNKNYPKLDIDLYTNASLLTPKISEEILKLKVHKINFSMNGTERSYRKIMGLNYNQTKENILYFLKKKRLAKKKYPLTNVSLMIIKENKDEVEKVINFWKHKSDSVMAYAPSDWAGSYKSQSIVTKNPFKSKRWPCYALFSSVMADVSGNVIMCCRDYESKVKFGNLLKENIRSIRNSKKFQELIEKHKNLNFNTPICNSCDNIFDSSLNWWA